MSGSRCASLISDFSICVHRPHVRPGTVAMSSQIDLTRLFGTHPSHPSDSGKGGKGVDGVDHGRDEPTASAASAELRGKKRPTASGGGQRPPMPTKPSRPRGNSGTNRRGTGGGRGRGKSASAASAVGVRNNTDASLPSSGAADKRSRQSQAARQLCDAAAGSQASAAPGAKPVPAPRSAAPEAEAKRRFRLAPPRPASQPRPPRPSRAHHQVVRAASAFSSPKAKAAEPGFLAKSPGLKIPASWRTMVPRPPMPPSALSAPLAALASAGSAGSLPSSDRSNASNAILSPGDASPDSQQPISQPVASPAASPAGSLASLESQTQSQPSPSSADNPLNASCKKAAPAQKTSVGDGPRCRMWRPILGKDSDSAVDSVEDAMKAASFYIDELLKFHFETKDLSSVDSDEIDAALRDIMDSMSEPYSTSCSGIEAPSVSRHELGYAIVQRLSHHTSWRPAPVRWTCEMDKECELEIETLFPKQAYPRMCVYRQMESFLAPVITDIRPVLARKSGQEAWEACLPIIRCGAAVVTKAECQRHGGLCEVVECHNHTGGTPCTAFSTVNNERPGLADDTFFALVVFVGLRCKLQEKSFTFENVPGVSQYIIEATSHLYWHSEAIINPAHHGFAISRQRVYINARHKLKSLPDIPLLSRFNQMFYRICNYTWTEYLFSHRFIEFEEQIASDVTAMQKRPTSIVQENKLHPGDWPRYSHGTTDDMVFWTALNKIEQKHWDQYLELFGPNEVYQLKDNPQCRPQYSKSGEMMCLLKSCGLLTTKVPQAGPVPRWLSGSECLFLQGFRTHPQLKIDGWNMSSFDLARSQPRVAEKMRSQSGNTMHVFCVMITQLHNYYTLRSKPIVPTESTFFSMLFSMAKPAKL